jgi:glutamyl-tRNA synthetase
VQSERLDVYKKAAFGLVQTGKAYLCDCTRERLEELRKEQQAKGVPTGYDGRCRKKSEIRNPKSETNIKLENLNLETFEELIDTKKFVVRMKMPESGKITIHDLIRGDVEFDLSLIDDQIILKSDGFPTYHLASVVDDHEMEITHVIRAEEWLSSTPKHLVLYEMFGWKAPEFAHLSMILGPDKKKLSKRHGATSIIEYKNEGYLPEALVNFIAFLGWNPKDEREQFTLEELTAEFKLENVNKSPAVFDIVKLNDINEKYIRGMAQGEKHNAKGILKDFGVENVSDGELELIGRGGYKTLKQAAEYIKHLRAKPYYDGKILIFKKSDKKTTLKGLEISKIELQTINEGEWNSQEIQMKLGLAVERNGLTNGDLFWPVRVALSGEEKSPSPAELAVALGKEKTVKRIEKAIEKLA